MTKEVDFKVEDDKLLADDLFNDPEATDEIIKRYIEENDNEVAEMLKVADDFIRDSFKILVKCATEIVTGRIEKNSKDLVPYLMEYSNLLIEHMAKKPSYKPLETDEEKKKFVENTTDTFLKALDITIRGLSISQ